MVFHWSLSNSNSPQNSWTLRSILDDLTYAVVCIVSTRPLIFKSSSTYTNPLVTVLREPITIGIIVTFMFHSFFSSLARSKYLSFFSLSFNSRQVHNYNYLLIRVFHISVSWWSFTGVWVIANLLKSPGLFSVFLPFSKMLFEWSLLVIQSL